MNKIIPLTYCYIMSAWYIDAEDKVFAPEVTGLMKRLNKQSGNLLEHCKKLTSDEQNNYVNKIMSHLESIQIKNQGVYYCSFVLFCLAILDEFKDIKMFDGLFNKLNKIDRIISKHLDYDYMLSEATVYIDKFYGVFDEKENKNKELSPT